MTSYTLQNYQTDIRELLSKSPHGPYERADEGVVYQVDTLLIKNLPKENKAEFIAWLSLFIMIDLVFFTYYKEHYPTLKKEFSTPKFEYGLSNQFLYPDSLLVRLLRYVSARDLDTAFRKITPEFNKLMGEFLHKLGLSIQEMQNTLIKDKDLGIGKFAMLYMNASGKNIEDYFKKSCDETYGITVWNRKKL